MPPIQPEQATALAPARVRTLVRKLRDLDLRTGWVAVTRRRSVRLEGCVAKDAPVEDGLSYRLVVRDAGTAERPGTLHVAAAGDGLDLVLDDPVDGRCERHVALVPADDGRALAPDCLARLDPESADRREVERFLRRLVRGVGPRT